MKKIILFTMMLLLVGCSQVETNKSDSFELTESEVDLHTKNVGTWLYEDDTISTISLYADGSFATNDSTLFDTDQPYSSFTCLGDWTQDGKTITFTTKKTLDESGSSDISKTWKADLTDGSLVINNHSYKKYDHDYAIVNVDNLNGRWQRTNVHKADIGSIIVKENQENSILFEAELYSGANTGSLTGYASFISENEALYISSTSSDNLETIRFIFTDNGLEVECTQGIDYFFGMGVYMEGLYTLDEPSYSNENVMIETFKTQERIDIVKNLLGNEGFSFLEIVMESGYQSSVDDLTYSAFVRGLGYAVNLIMSEDDYLYCLTYGQDNREYYYTNDPNSKWLMHPSLVDKVRDLSNLCFVYDDNNESMIYDEYVWIRGHYSKPSSWSNSITFERDMSEYVEVIVSDEIYDFKVLSLHYDENWEFENTSPIYELPSLSSTFVMNTYHPEGIPSEAIVFKDKLGKEHTYVISERSLRGKLFDVNELIIPLNYTSHHRVINSESEGRIMVPYLQHQGESIESFIPKGWQLLDAIDVDFNGDSITDKVGVIEKDYGDKIYDVWEYPRLLFALKGNDYGYTLDFQDINLVRHAREGGIYGDPYLPLTSDGKDFTINAYGGSAWKWSERSTFTYIEDQWYLKEEETHYGYGPHETGHRFYNYATGYGVRDYNHSGFDDIENASSTDFDLSFEVTLGPMESLSSYSERCMLARFRLGELALEETFVTNAIAPIDRQTIVNAFKNPFGIKDMNEDYIIVSVPNEDLGKEQIIKYNRHSRNATVMLEGDYISSYQNVFEDVKIDNDTIYYVENQFIIDNDHPYVKNASVMRFDSFGEHELLTTFDNVPVDGKLGYFSVSILDMYDQMICTVYGNGFSKYYRLNVETKELEYLGEVRNK